MWAIVSYNFYYYNIGEDNPYHTGISKQREIDSIVNLLLYLEPKKKKTKTNVYRNPKPETHTDCYHVPHTLPLHTLILLSTLPPLHIYPYCYTCVHRSPPHSTTKHTYCSPHTTTTHTVLHTPPLHTLRDRWREREKNKHLRHCQVIHEHCQVGKCRWRVSHAVWTVVMSCRTVAFCRRHVHTNQLPFLTFLWAFTRDEYLSPDTLAACHSETDDWVTCVSNKYDYG